MEHNRKTRVRRRSDTFLGWVSDVYIIPNFRLIRPSEEAYGALLNLISYAKLKSVSEGTSKSINFLISLLVQGMYCEPSRGRLLICAVKYWRHCGSWTRS